MNTFSIKQTLKKIALSYELEHKKKLFYRVCACDLLPNRIPNNQETIIIVNLDTSDKSGSHWQAMWFSFDRTCYFFDSYGQQPTNHYIKNFIKTHAHTTYWNKQQIQSYYSYCCGEYCCMFAYSMAKIDAITCFFKQFSTNLHSNDDKIRSMYNCTFNNRGCSQGCKSYFNCINSA